MGIRGRWKRSARSSASRASASGRSSPRHCRSCAIRPGRRSCATTWNNTPYGETGVFGIACDVSRVDDACDQIAVVKGDKVDQNDIKSLPRNDQGVLAAGVLALIASFFPFYGASVNFGGISGSSSINTWHSYATLGILLVLAATALAAEQGFAGSSLPEMPVTANFVVAALSALGALLIIVRGFTYDTASAPGASVGLKWGAYVVMILCLAQVAFAVMRLRAAGEPMPWHHSGGASAPPAA